MTEPAKKERQKRMRLVTGETLLSLESVMLKCDIGKTKLMELVEAGIFPQPSPGLKALGFLRWRGSIVDAWILEADRSLEHGAQMRSVK